MNKNEVRGVIMAALFISGEAVETEVFAELLGTTTDEIESIVAELISELELGENGILLKRVGGKVQLATNPKYAAQLKQLFAPEVRESLSNSVLESLSIVAYKQPVTRSEIDEIRGVRSNYAVTTLIEKGLIVEIGRKDVLGRPALFATTDEFLRHFDIASLEELPKIDFAPQENEGETPAEEFPV